MDSLFALMYEKKPCFPQWRSQLEVLFDCHRVLDFWPTARFPAPGELIDDNQRYASVAALRADRPLSGVRSRSAGSRHEAPSIKKLLDLLTPHGSFFVHD